MILNVVIVLKKVWKLNYASLAIITKDIIKKKNDELNENSFVHCYKGEIEGYYLDEDEKIYNPCFSTCKICSISGNNENHNCIECLSNYTLNNNGNCEIIFRGESWEIIDSDDIVIESKSNTEEIENETSIINEEQISDDSAFIDENIQFDLNNINNDHKTYIGYNLNDILKELSKFNKIKLNISIIDELIIYIEKNITNINSNELLSIIKKGQDIIFIDNDDIQIALTSTEIENNNKNKNITTINLCECENKLKEENNISNNESLLIYKIKVNKSDMKIPKLEYKVFYPLNENKLKNLNLTICQNTKIEIGIPMIFNNQKDIDKSNLNSEYYKSICYIDTSDKGTNISLQDRKDIYLNDNLYPCEEICNFKEYNRDITKTICSCKVKQDFKLYSEIKIYKELLLTGFKNIDTNIINLNVMKCYHILFNINGILKNLGFYIILSIILFHFLSIIIFYKLDNKAIKKAISNITKCNSTKGDESEKKYKNKKVFINKLKNKKRSTGKSKNNLIIKKNKKNSNKRNIK